MVTFYKILSVFWDIFITLLKCVHQSILSRSYLHFKLVLASNVHELHRSTKIEKQKEHRLSKFIILIQIWTQIYHGHWRHSLVNFCITGSSTGTLPSESCHNWSAHWDSALWTLYVQEKQLSVTAFFKYYCKVLLFSVHVLHKTYHVKYLISFTIFMLMLRSEFTYHRMIRNY